MDFNREVRPVLSDNCFQCHGPDENTREAGLRLDLKDAVLNPADGDPVVVPGTPESSEIVRRIFASDPEVRMPPAESKRSLAPEEKDRIRRWIAEGAGCD